MIEHVMLEDTNAIPCISRVPTYPRRTARPAPADAGRAAATAVAGVPAGGQAGPRVWNTSAPDASTSGSHRNSTSYALSMGVDEGRSATGVPQRTFNLAPVSAPAHDPAVRAQERAEWHRRMAVRHSEAPREQRHHDEAGAAPAGDVAPASRNGSMRERQSRQQPNSSMRERQRQQQSNSSLRERQSKQKPGSRPARPEGPRDAVSGAQGPRDAVLSALDHLQSLVDRPTPMHRADFWRALYTISMPSKFMVQADKHRIVAHPGFGKLDELGTQFLPSSGPQVGAWLANSAAVMLTQTCSAAICLFRGRAYNA